MCKCVCVCLPFRKQDLREIRVLQREEQKECQALADRIESERDALEKKYEARKAVS